jgi:glycosyltransferase involved in cell wall biosynthesis
VIKVLSVIDYYIPGFKAGGPQRTLQYLVESLGDEFDFRILTRDRDLGDTAPYPAIQADSWQRVGKGTVFYTPVDRLSLTHLLRILRDTHYDVLYLNSVFSPDFTLKPLLLRRLGLLRDTPVIVRPRGELNKGAIALKGAKKRVYLALTKLLGLYGSIIWHASTAHEVDDIHRHFGDRLRVIVAPNLARPFADSPAPPPCEKVRGHLKLVFLSRISTKKNLAGALGMLDGLQGEVEMNVYGPVEEADYWEQCQAIADHLPHNIKVRYQGPVAPEDVTDVFSAHHLMLFPTFGENFGHVIFEALAAGCPILLSDQTPWRGLQEKGCGWDFPLSEQDAFRRCLQDCVDMEADAFNRLSRGARECALDYSRNSGGVEQNRELFRAAAMGRRA